MLAATLGFTTVRKDTQRRKVDFKKAASSYLICRRSETKHGLMNWKWYHPQRNTAANTTEARGERCTESKAVSAPACHRWTQNETWNLFHLKCFQARNKKATKHQPTLHEDGGRWNFSLAFCSRHRDTQCCEKGFVDSGLVSISVSNLSRFNRNETDFNRIQPVNTKCKPVESTEMHLD